MITIRRRDDNAFGGTNYDLHLDPPLVRSDGEHAHLLLTAGWGLLAKPLVEVWLDGGICILESTTSLPQDEADLRLILGGQVRSPAPDHR